jgi:uncharacterized membrane protein ArfC
VNHVHWWLFALSWVTGLVLTLALTIRPVKRQVPVGTSAGRSAKTEPPTTKIPAAKEAPTTKIPTVPHAPYGPGSARATRDGGGPAGWLVKGRSDTRLYYTPDDATYDSTVAQVWFKDEKSAARPLFTPWRKRPGSG